MVDDLSLAVKLGKMFPESPPCLLCRDLRLLGLLPGLRLPGLAGYHAAPGHALKQLLYFRSAVDELVRPELERRVLDKFDEGDEETPGVRPVHDQPLEQYPANKFCKDNC